MTSTFFSNWLYFAIQLAGRVSENGAYVYYLTKQELKRALMGVKEVKIY